MVLADIRSGVAASPGQLVPFVVKQGLATQVHQAGFPDVTQVDPLRQESLTAPRVSSVIEGQSHTVFSAVIPRGSRNWIGWHNRLIASFAVNTGPPTGDTAAQLTAFEQQHLDAILRGAWPVRGAR